MELSTNRCHEELTEKQYDIEMSAMKLRKKKWSDTRYTLYEEDAQEQEQEPKIYCDAEICMNL